jgi:hypothetical protein
LLCGHPGSLGCSAGGVWTPGRRPWTVGGDVDRKAGGVCWCWPIFLDRVEGEESAEGWVRRSSAPGLSSFVRWRLHCSISLRQIRQGWSSDCPFCVRASSVGSCRAKLLAGSVPATSAATILSPFSFLKGRWGYPPPIPLLPGWKLLLRPGDDGALRHSPPWRRRFGLRGQRAIGVVTMTVVRFGCAFGEVYGGSQQVQGFFGRSTTSMFCVGRWDGKGPSFGNSKARRSRSRIFISLTLVLLLFAWLVSFRLRQLSVACSCVYLVQVYVISTVVS